MSGLQPSNLFLSHNLGLRPRLVYVGPLALNDDVYRSANSAVVSQKELVSQEEL